MKRLSALLMLVTALVLLTATVALGAPKLQTFGTGEVTLTGDDSATIDNAVGEYGGVYLNSRSQSGKFLAEVDFSFVSTGDVAGGAPRFSIPIDDMAIPGPTDFEFSYGYDVAYAFLDVLNCGSNTVSTESLTCPVSGTRSRQPTRRTASRLGTSRS
jgi:hypothetical protein